ncbi:MAG: T9SS type A sorting domain-containing protein, partial [Flavobacteriales bacterium]|nr:T9SS type A sorting domain-containing protein [Flavobacteriales bacterium]
AGSLGDGSLSWSGTPVVPDPAIQCQTLGVAEEPVRSLIAHPNPTKEQMTLQGTYQQVLAFDALGRTVDLPVIRTQVDATLVDLSFLASGIYPIQAVDRAGNRYAGRVVVLP